MSAPAFIKVRKKKKLLSSDQTVQSIETLVLNDARVLFWKQSLARNRTKDF